MRGPTNAPTVTPITVITPIGLRWLNAGPPLAMDRYRLRAKNRPPPIAAPIMVHRPVAFKTTNPTSSSGFYASRREPSHASEPVVHYVVEDGAELITEAHPDVELIVACALALAKQDLLFGQPPGWQEYLVSDTL